MSSAIYLSIEMDSFYASPLLYILRNEEKRFYCEAVGLFAFWGINSSTIHDDGAEPWNSTGFTFNKVVDHDMTGTQNIHHNTLRIPALMDHNNTVIFCVVIDGNSLGHVRSSVVKIILMGKLNLCIQGSWRQYHFILRGQRSGRRKFQYTTYELIERETSTIII